MNIQTLIIECESCGEEIKHNVGQIGIPANVVHVEMLDQSDFTCENCGTTHFVEVQIYAE